MTDINRWPELVQVVKLRYRGLPGHDWQNGPDGEPIFSEYVTLPFNEYTLGHLLGMLKRAEDNGDWWSEMAAMCAVAMEQAGLQRLDNNWGDVFTLDDVKAGRLCST